MYEARVKFVELGERYTLPVRGTREYKELQSRYELCGTFQWGNGGLTLVGFFFRSRVSKALEATEISQVQGFVEVEILKFKR